MADEKSKVLNQDKYQKLLNKSLQTTRTGEVIEPVFDYNEIDDYTKLAVKDIIDIIDSTDNKQIASQIIKEKFKLENIPIYDENKSLWKQMMKEFKLGESIQGYKVIIKDNGKKEKIPVLGFTAELDYLDEVLKKVMFKMKEALKNKEDK